MVDDRAPARLTKEKSVYLRLAKCWQGATHFILWQVQAGGAVNRAALPKKFFLQVDCHQANRGMRLLSQKTENLRLDGPIAALLRKYVPGGGVAHLWRDNESADLWLPVQRGPEDAPYALLRLSKETPPVLSLIMAGGEVVFRFSQQGTFTHRKQYPDALPIFSGEQGRFTDLLPELLNEFGREALDEAANADAGAVAGPAVAAVQDTEKAVADLPSTRPLLQPGAGGVFSELQREARSKLARREKTVRKALGRQEADLPTTAEVELLALKAKLLQSYSYLVKPGSLELTLDAALTGEPEGVSIELDAELSVGQNVEALFASLKKKKKALSLGQDRLTKNRQAWQQLQDDLAKLRDGELSTAEIVAVLKRHQLSMPETGGRDPSKRAALQAGQPGLPYKIFQGQGAVRYLVGKGPSDNDALTRQARSNDYWLHVMTGSGSHVIVPSKSLPKGQLDTRSKRDAAILAIHYSKFRSDQAAEVYVTQRRHLRKTKGLAAGLWLVDKSEAFFIRFSPEELQEVLSRMQA